MAKFSRIPKLSKQKRQDLLIDFCEALSTIKNGKEAAKFITDLLSPQEVEMIAKRLAIAELLLKGWQYQAIRDELKVGFSTIARVNLWLQMAGEGFKMVIARKKKRPKTPTDEEIYDRFSSYNIKRRYPKYFWPSLVIEELIKISDERNRSKILTILQSMDNKKWYFDKETNKEIFEAMGQNLKKKAI